ncbi:MAG TPA: hypothetical protein DDZ96_04425 [Porphyromonadaceae bacterium]|nr:hypothetical protein [Porphyromonadaceae bacterium]HBX20924.1 hypothetical protein [Porphyromonadaceae bacterium]HCM19663.1 hypothetical protein [Porphyromonadaceae bacterium]
MTTYFPDTVCPYYKRQKTMTKNTFSALVSKELGGNLSDKERKELQEILAQDRRLKKIYDEIHVFMEKKASGIPADLDAKLDEVWHRIENADVHQPYSQSHSRRIIPVWARIVASVAILIGLSIIGYRYLPSENLYSEAIEAGDENLYAVLDDGTQVWLGKHSRLAHNARFGTGKRRIALTGEAFFDVARNAAVPLVVSAGDVDITVKGTAFNVSARAKEIEIALVRGSVAVKEKRRGAKEVLLKPNQKIVVRDKGTFVTDSNYVIRDLIPANDSILPETQWLKGALVFRKQKFGDLVKLMEGRYNVSIRIDNPQLSDQRFTGSIKSETLEQMLDALKQSYPFTYKMEGRQVIIK